MNQNNNSVELLESWDPLSGIDTDEGIIIAAQRREIQNILKSYTGYYDLYAELTQNALDAVERRLEDGIKGYKPNIWITINMSDPSVTVIDNGCGMELGQFKKFVKPNLSYKDGPTRGSKGVGATYLAYGFNHLEVCTKPGDGKVYSGILKNGRSWVEDKSFTIERPKFEPYAQNDSKFNAIDRGTMMRIKLIGKNIRPKNLSWIGAYTAEQWLTVLRITTPIGGLYFENEPRIEASIHIEVIDERGTSTIAYLDKPNYLFPHEATTRVADLREFLKWQMERVDKNQDVSKVPPKFEKLLGLWGYWTGQEILENKSPINSKLDKKEQSLIQELGIKLYIFLAYSTELWDNINDKKFGIRQGQRILRGGLQLGTRHMPQGLPITIPMTNNIGFQNLAHVIIHFDNAEPDLGRKGFQPEHVNVAEKLAVSAVTAFRKQADKLRKPGAAKIYGDDLNISNWIKIQETHEKECPMLITGRGLFMPTEELPIRSEPLVEQDVVALFNQMLSSGLIRGIQLISSSQYKQYDGLYRIRMTKPFNRFCYSKENPLGIDEDHFSDCDLLETPIKILEYKHNIDGLIEEFQTGVKSADNVSLAIAWELGEKWREMFDITPYLIEENVHHRKIHGTTHSFTHSMSGQHAFEVIVIKDLVSYLSDPSKEEVNQRKKYFDDMY